MSCGKGLRKSAKGCRKICGGKKDKITRPKYKSLCLSPQHYVLDCNKLRAMKTAQVQLPLLETEWVNSQRKRYAEKQISKKKRRQNDKQEANDYNNSAEYQEMNQGCFSSAARMGQRQQLKYHQISYGTSTEGDFYFLFIVITARIDYQNLSYTDHLFHTFLIRGIWPCII